VDRIFGRLMDFRRLTPDYETLPSRSAAMIHLAMTDLLCRRLTQQLGASATSANHRDQMPTIAKSRSDATSSRYLRCQQTRSVANYRDKSHTEYGFERTRSSQLRHVISKRGTYSGTTGNVQVHDLPVLSRSTVMLG